MNIFKECTETETGEFVVSATAKVRLEIENGRHHEDIGFSSKIGPPSILAVLKAQTKQESLSHLFYKMLSLKNKTMI